ncbi:MAG: hypothetical protein V3V78_05015 [Candidatus Woesearchaeota archaeon]
MVGRLFPALEVIVRSDFEIYLSNPQNANPSLKIFKSQENIYWIGPGEEGTKLAVKRITGKKSANKMRHISSQSQKGEPGLAKVIIYDEKQKDIEYWIMQKYAQTVAARETPGILPPFGCNKNDFETRQKEMAVEMRGSSWFKEQNPWYNKQ